MALFILCWRVPSTYSALVAGGFCSDDLTVGVWEGRGGGIQGQFGLGPSRLGGTPMQDHRHQHLWSPAEKVKSEIIPLQARPLPTEETCWLTPAVLPLKTVLCASTALAFAFWQPVLFADCGYTSILTPDGPNGGLEASRGHDFPFEPAAVYVALLGKRPLQPLWHSWAKGDRTVGGKQMVVGAWQADGRPAEKVVSAVLAVARDHVSSCGRY